MWNSLDLSCLLCAVCKSVFLIAKKCWHSITSFICRASDMQLTTKWKLGFTYMIIYILMMCLSFLEAKLKFPPATSKDHATSINSKMLSMNNSTTANNATSEAPHVSSEVAVILTSVFICIVMLATIVGNSLVIFCVCYYPRLRGRTNYLIVSLAVADWLVGTISLPLRLAQTVNQDSWPFSHTACQFWIWVDMLCSAASILSLTVISFDRLIAVVDPLKYENRMRPSRVYAMIGITWTFALICACLSLHKWEGSVILHRPQCAIISKEYVTFVSTAAFFVPLTVVFVNYSVIFKIAVGHAYRLQKESRSLATNYCADVTTDPTTDANHNADLQVDQSRKSFLKRSIFSLRKDPRQSGQRSATFALVKQLKATKTLAVVLGIFCLCWFPFFVIFLMFQHCGNPCFVPPRMSKTTLHAIKTVFINILPVANSAANPIIYSCFNVEFRKAFKRILAKVLKRKESFDNLNTSFSVVPSSNCQKEVECPSP